MDTLHIKEVKIAEEYPVIAEFMHHLHKHEHGLFDKTAHWPDIENAYMRHVIKMQEDGDGMCLIAYKENVPVGFIFGYLEDQDDSRIEIYEGKELYVSDGFVAEHYRNQGIYRKLNQYLENHFLAKGVQRITRFTLINNTAMRHVLENEGYFVTRLLYEKWIE